MSFALTVDAPAGQFTESIHLLDSLSARLARLGCCIESCGWSTRATVIAQTDGYLERVRDLLVASGCSIDQERRLNCEPLRTTGQQMQYNFHHWNHPGWRDDLFPDFSSSEKQVEDETAATEPEVQDEDAPVILPMRPAA